MIDELPPNVSFDVMAFGGQSTVAAAQPLEGKRSTSYQSEAELEAAFIKQLQRQAYEYVRIGSEAELIANLRRQLEALNAMTFTDKEWDRFFRASIAADNEGIVEKTRHSFKFTSWWADANNKPIQDLVPFTKAFFAKHALLNILTKYCVFDVEEKLLVMRPYQIVATERILNRILVSENDKSILGTLRAGGYVWHTTGSGNTATS